MSSISVLLHRLKTQATRGYWQDRLYAQLGFAAGLSAARQGQYDALLTQILTQLWDRFAAERCIAPQDARQAEAALQPLAEDAHSYTLHCMAHAHIDMNWMWRFDETVAITLDTVRTMLDLLAEYPQFTFSQSQASIYRIIEEYGPADMLEAIRRYVAEGRWEVTANTWVEADKNMPNGESMARHLLYTRRYLARLLNINPQDIRIDFEPDTFGHSAHVPEVLAGAGIEYYYHCRGSSDPELTWWQAPSGNKILCYHDPAFYNAVVEADIAVPMIDTCRKLGVDTLLKIYGVGDHGGGPSRRDIERLTDMQSWTCYPTILFSTYHAFFDAIKAKYGDTLPVTHAERNPVFTGCYTTQTRIKQANRVSEATLYDAELFSALGHAVADYDYPADRFEQAWEKTLFNQFHDILTGSGVTGTREYAMGEFQKAMATANTQRLNAMRAIAGLVDTSAYCTGENPGDFRNVGGGVGFGIHGFRVSQADRGDGTTRVFHVFNSAPYPRSGLCRITVWDMAEQDLPTLAVTDARGDRVPHQLLAHGTSHYWGHTYAEALIPVSVPACGWATYVLRQSDCELADRADPFPLAAVSRDLIEPLHSYTLENDYLRVVLDTTSGEIVSYYDKQNQREWIAPGQSGGFKLIEEDTNMGMTAWRVGRHISCTGLSRVRLSLPATSGAALRRQITLKAAFSRSELSCTLSLDKDSRALKLDVTCDWHERGTPDTQIPQLAFALPLAQPVGEYTYDIPFGTQARPAQLQDLPGLSLIAARPQEGPALVLSSDCKYGYRGEQGRMMATLIRGSYDPDPSPEYGVHRMGLAVCLCDNTPAALVRCGFDLWHEFCALTAPAHSGVLPLIGSLVELESDNLVLQSVKLAEDDPTQLVVRLYGADTTGGRGSLRFNLPVGSQARLCDLDERPTADTLPIADGLLALDLPAGRVLNLMVPLADL